MPPKYRFSDNEKVLCYHGPLLYEAKVRVCVSVSRLNHSLQWRHISRNWALIRIHHSQVTKVQTKDKTPQFLVHYAGWSRR